MKSQKQMFYQAQKQLGERDRAFMELVGDPQNPMTNNDLRALVKRHPERYGRYAGFIGTMSD